MNDLKALYRKEIEAVNKFTNLLIKYDGLKQKGRMTWLEFKKEAHAINKNSFNYNEDFFDSFLEDNKHNPLPYSSSGSFYSAASDTDHIDEYFEDEGLSLDEMEKIKSSILYI